MKIKINGTEIETIEGETLLETACRNGFPVPSLCYAKDRVHKPGCALCIVKECRKNQLILSCATPPVEGMEIDTEHDDVQSGRRSALELLLMEHRADCEAPCSTVCPAGLDIAGMNRLYDQQRYAEALELLRDTLAIPAMLCYICPAPCEKVCRKKELGQAVPIREIKKRLVAGTILKNINADNTNGKKVAVIGSDPAALSAAYRLCRLGYKTVIFEKSSSILTPYINMDSVPVEVYQQEIEVFKESGVEIITAYEAPYPKDFDGIISTACENPEPAWMVLSAKTKHPAQLVSEGRKLANEMHALLSKNRADKTIGKKIFNSRFSHFTDKEKKILSVHSETDTNSSSGCLYCDCDKKTACKLRHYATFYGLGDSRIPAVQTQEIPALDRRKVTGDIWFEGAKCIKCGLCVYNSRNGFTFSGRGLNMHIVPPPENTGNIDEELTRLCPTGALYIKKQE